MADKNFLDGNYEFEEVKDAMNIHFASEKELCAYIEKHIGLFTKDCLNVELKSYKREFCLGENMRTIKNNRRLDFVIETKCGKRIGIECKVPTFKSELSAAIGQCLTYLALFELNEKKLDAIYLISTKIDSVLPLVIDRFKLPIGFIAFDKDKFLTYKDWTSGQ